MPRAFFARSARSAAGILACTALALGAAPGLGAGAAAAGPAPAYVAPDAPLAGHPRLALLPLEDFSGKAESGEVATRILFAELVRTGVCEVVERGQVDAAVDDLHIRDTGSLTSEQVLQLSEKLNASFLMVGSLLESGTVRTPDGDVPAVALALRILDGRTGRVVWADMMARTGEDKETLFGWGREYDANKMTQQMAAAMFRSLSELTVPHAEKAGGRRARPERAGGKAPGAGRAPVEGKAPPDSLAPSDRQPVENPSGGKP